MVVPYSVEGNAFRAEKPRVWVDARFTPRSRTGPNRHFDLHPDGERFALAPIVTTAEEVKRDKVVFVFNFFDELRRVAKAMRALLKEKQSLPADVWPDLEMLAPAADFRSRHGSVMLSFDAVEKALDTRSSMGVIGDMGKFQQFQMGHAIRDAAKNPAGGVAGAGIGLGMGFGMASQFAQGGFGMASVGAPAGESQGQAAPPPPPPPAGFHVTMNGQTQGPYAPEQLVAGGITPETLVWSAGMAGIGGAFITWMISDSSSGASAAMATSDRSAAGSAGSTSIPPSTVPIGWRR